MKTTKKLVQVASELERNALKNDELRLISRIRSFRQPTASELADFIGLRDSPTRAQELRNQFARLLNRGSSLE